MTSLVLARKSFFWLPTYRSKWWWACLILVSFMVLLTTATLVYAAVCTFTTSQAVGRSGITNSYLVVERDGIGDSFFNVSAVDTPDVTTAAATDVEMVGYPHATLNGQVTDMGNVASTEVFWQWGYDASYGNATGTQIASATGNYSVELSGFNPDKEIYFRMASVVCGQYSYGSGQAFQIAETPSYWKITSFIPIAFMVGIVFVLIKTFTNTGSVGALVLAIIGGLIFFLVAINFAPVIFEGIEGAWGG